MAAHYFNTVENNVTGKPVASAEVSVLTAPSASGGTEVTIYSDEALSVTIDNPITTDSKGFFEFYTSSDSVCLEIAYGGTTQKVIDNVNLVGGTVSGDVSALQVRMDAVEAVTQDPMIVDIAALTDPGADRIAFWDESANEIAWLTPNTNLGISGTNLNVTGLGTAAALDETTTAQYRANTADKVLSTDQVWAAAAYVALTDAATVDVDMSAGFNFSLTIGGNRTLGAPTNTKDGQTGAIVITQDGTGSRTLAYHANWKFAGGTDPTLSTAAGAVDVLFYQVISSTVIVGNLVKAIA